MLGISTGENEMAKKIQRDASPMKYLESVKDQYKGDWPTLVEVFDITAKMHPQRRCFTIYDPDCITYTYKETQDMVERVSAMLLRKGIQKGDRVVITGKNSPDWAIAYLAILVAGGIVVPVDYQLTLGEIRNLVEFSDAKYLFVDEERYDEFSVEEMGLLGKSNFSKGEGYYQNEITDERLRGEAPSEYDLAAILYTSGTTGTPKGVMLTHRNFTSDLFLARTHLEIYKEDVFYALLPIHHSYTMTSVFLESIGVGAEIVFGKKMVVAQILKDMKEGKVTMFLGAPILFNKLLKGLMSKVKKKSAITYGLVRCCMGISSVTLRLFNFRVGNGIFKKLLDGLSLGTNRICISGGGPLPASTVKQFNILGIQFVEGYGLTETAPMLSLNPIEGNTPGSVGRILPEIDYKIINTDENGYGEFVVKGPMVTQGYYKNPEATAELFTEEGYLKTGDIGYVNDKGFLFLTGRAKSMIVTEGGKNVFPEEIEDRFQLFDEIDQILVISFTKDAQKRLTGIKAMVYPSDEYRKEPNIEERINEIILSVNKELKPYEKIEKVEIQAEPLEMTTTKKIKRFKYQETKLW